ncbi:MAG: hypothetical protein ACFB0Z_06840 [Candidatus Phaeomarinobacter sp.]
MNDLVERLAVVAGGVIIAAAIVGWAKGAGLPLISDVAAMAHEGFDG